ncbi:uncharacterized protein BDCG_17114 [Blastomyces dermatitidis ER-3]|uniref:Uncharacterized protein n=2 Tax=Ajellomyces dermatitidis TaxID=5039 RepID=A0A0J9ERI7_AJEDA|nr:uncharacterized protein BDCG_17114 [Blastomyces dermatitidis ER-3]KMW68923.1 hypothetical protein BDDG_13134 [Blastomyces dermatitidis ATCC 18188]OAT01504.1 hypothetical protein BDCG_17114 [Blastomyces dermatitidis ER-3]
MAMPDVRCSNTWQKQEKTRKLLKPGKSGNEYFFVVGSTKKLCSIPYLIRKLATVPAASFGHYGDRSDRLAFATHPM